VDQAIAVVNKRYGQEPAETDEFLKPIVFSDESRVKGSIFISKNKLCLFCSQSDDDTLIFFNYRSDRMREITECMGMEKWKELQSSVPHPKNLQLTGMTQYNKEVN
jgi:2,3-bisphosphoglycerate-independent phosphoglycerate mutase